MEIEATQPRILDKKTAYAGANWFFWLAILSIVNSLLVWYLGIRNTPVAFGVTQWFDGTTGPMTAEGVHPPLHTAGLIGNILIAAAFAGFGYFARRGNERREKRFCIVSTVSHSGKRSSHSFVLSEVVRRRGTHVNRHYRSRTANRCVE